MIYNKYKKYDFWNIVEDSINDLVKNQDLILQTPNDYIIWYIVKNIMKKSSSLK